MTSAAPSTELEFEPPAAGSWSRDAVHFPRPVTRYFAETHPEAFMRGFRDMTRFYGLLVDTMETRYVHGFAYSTMRPVPPEEVPERFKRAEEVFAGRLWREQLREWDEQVKPAAIARHRELQAVNPDALDDAELAAYLERCRDHHAAMMAQHMRYTGAAMVPVGDLLAHAGEWTGLPQAQLLDLMRGAAPVSAGGSDEQEELVRALAEDASARAVLEAGGDPGEVLERLRTLDGDAGRAVSAYLDLIGFRLLDGFDISGRYALELPDALVRSIRAMLERPADDGDVSARIAEVRERVPDEHRAAFDELVEEARLTYRIRDERGVYSDIWASGLMRRAVLAAGRRLAERGRLQDPEHLVDATVAEMRALLSGEDGPTAEELAARHRFRTSMDGKEAPPVIGDPPSPPPDPSGLPPATARVMRAVGISIMALFDSSDAPHEEHLLRGLGASGGVYEGPARRVAGPDEFDRIKQGDVLVTESTTEAFNILLPLLGGIVTDSGGLLSHSAIVAREYGIPGVVGTREATARIADGAIVRVDGDAGEVTVRG